MAETYLLAMRCPVYRRRDSDLGSGGEPENLGGDVKGKDTSGGPARPKVPMHHPGADCFVAAMKRGTPVERRERGTRASTRMGQLHSRMNRLRRKAVAFMEWHEPDKSRGLRPVL
jgi:hypothetical protein